MASSIPSQTAGASQAEGTGTAGLNPVKREQPDGSGPDLPWDDPKWFNEQLRAHMLAEHREELMLLLMADS